MGRQVALLQRYPVSVVAQPLAMPPLPPRPPKKRYLLENPPLRPPPIQDDSVPPLAAASAPVAPPVATPPTDHPVNLVSSTPSRASPPVPPNGVNGNHCGASDAPKAAEEQPLNLSTSNSQEVYHPNNQEVHLSNIVDRVVEKMLWKRPSDSARSGDPLRAWFSNQFETRQRSDGSSSSGDSSAGGVARPHSASPRLAGIDPEKDRSRDPDPDPDPDPDRDRLSHGSAGVLEVTIGMSETISRVIDNVYRQDSGVAVAVAGDAALLGRRGSAPAVRDTDSPPVKRRPPPGRDTDSPPVKRRPPAASVTVTPVVVSTESLVTKSESPRPALCGAASPRHPGGRLSPRQSGGELSPRQSAEEVSPPSGYSSASNRETDSPTLVGGRLTSSTAPAVTSASAPVTVSSPARGPAPAAAPAPAALDASASPGIVRAAHNTPPTTPPGSEGRPLRVTTASPRPGADSPRHRGVSPRSAGSPRPSAVSPRPSGGPQRPPAGPPRTAASSPSRRGRKRGLPTEPAADADGRNPVGGNSDSSAAGGQ